MLGYNYYKFYQEIYFATIIFISVITNILKHLFTVHASGIIKYLRYIDVSCRNEYIS